MIEDDLRRTASEARMAGRSTAAEELADLVAAVREVAAICEMHPMDDREFHAWHGMLAKLAALDEATDST